MNSAQLALKLNAEPVMGTRQKSFLGKGLSINTDMSLKNLISSTRNTNEKAFFMSFEPNKPEMDVKQPILNTNDSPVFPIHNSFNKKYSSSSLASKGYGQMNKIGTFEPQEPKK